MSVGQGISAFTFDPALPVWLVIVLAAVAVLVLGPAILRRAQGWPWRAAALLVLVAWLAGPELVRETWQNLPDTAVLLVDRTASMGVDGRTAEAAAAAAKVREEAARLPDLEFRTAEVPATSGTGTELFAALDRALAEVPRGRLAGVIAITDGEVSDVPKPAASPLEGAPLSVLIPAAGEQTDRSVRLLAAPTYGIVGREVALQAEIDDHGVPGAAAGSARLSIRINGAAAEVESVPVGRPITIPIAITRAGPTVVELTAEKLTGEVSTLNNSAVVTINGVRNRLRVLLVSGYPDPGVRAWRQLLKSDPAVDLVHFTILRPPDKEDGTPLNELALIAFPAHELFVEKLSHFDLIILDQFQNDGLLPPVYLQNIASYVEGGGALMVTVGPEFAGPDSMAITPLADVLPASPVEGPAGVVVGGFRPLLSDVGERHPVTAGLPGAGTGEGGKPGAPTWGPWYRYDATNAVSGEVLIKTPGGAPLLVLKRIDKGRVAMLLSDQMWLWARGHDGGGPEAELMRRVAHWLMKEPALEENAITAHLADGRMVVERRTLAANATGEAVVTAPDGKKSTLKLTETGPGRATGSFAASAPGVWQVSEAGRTTFAASGPADPMELADLRATATLLAPLVQASGGRVHWLRTGGVPELRRVEPGEAAGGPGWVGLRRNHAHRVTGVTQLPLLPAWAALPLLLGLMVLAWQREGAEPPAPGTKTDGAAGRRRGVGNGSNT